MGERKVLNKYYPPDFDPEKLPRNRRPKGQQVVVRVMLPFSVQCKTCGEYVYRGKKFNARKEEVLGGDYLGIRVWRFYIKCTNCVSEITFRTDPKNADYVCEAGAARNFEPWRQDRHAEAEMKKEKADEEADAIKALENRTAQSKREMEMLDQLEELKDINVRQANLDYNAIIEARRQQDAGSVELNEEGLAKEDLELLESVDFSRRLKDDDDYNDADGDDIDPDWTFGHNTADTSTAPPPGGDAASSASGASSSTVSASPAASLLSSTPAPAPAATSGFGSGLIVVKKRKPEDRADKEKSKEKKKHKKKSKDKEAKPTGPATPAAAPSKTAPATAAPSGLASLAAYDDDSDS